MPDDEMKGIEPPKVGLLAGLFEAPTPTAGDVLADGYWCTQCLTFEQEELDDADCIACGCPPEAHVDVEVRRLPQ